MLCALRAPTQVGGADASNVGCKWSRGPVAVAIRRRLRHNAVYPYYPLTLHVADIVDREAMRRVLSDQPEPFDAILNLAARAGVRRSVEDPWVYVDTNVRGTVTLLDLARAFDVPKFVLASTSSVYGTDASVPFSEDQPTDRPISPYAASKKSAEAMCYTYHCLHGLDVSILRYFTVYGPAGRPDMAPFRFVRNIREKAPIVVNGDGTQSRDFTFVDDIVRGTVAALRPLGFQIVNLGNQHPVPLLQLIALIERATGAASRIEFRAGNQADVAMTCVRVSKAKDLLGWSPDVPLEDGVRHRSGHGQKSCPRAVADLARGDASTRR